MLLTIFLLGLLYVVFVGVLLAAGAGVGIMVVVIAGLLIAQLFLSDKLALAAMGAKRVSPEEAPGFHAMIERLCIQADLPKPKIATTGIMNILEPHELEGVMAHELTHVKNRDVMIMTIASFFASIAAVITQFGFFFGGGFGGDDDDGGAPFAVVLLVSLAVYVISFFLMLALSRYREYGADRGAAIITGRPSALSSALMKLSGAMQRVPDQDLRAVGRMNAFFIVPTSVKQSVATLFMTHPPMEKRIERLQQYEAQLQGTAIAA
jgi:heat shock protein HtpX